MPYLSAPLGIVRVVGTSMSPTLAPGDLLLIRRRSPRRPGALVIARLPPEADGTPRPVAVKWLAGPDPSDATRWWLERDNPTAGADSWLFGSVGSDDIRAVVVCRLWPPPHRLAARSAG